MVNTVSFERTTYRDGPARFEAGTGHIAGAVGLAAALDYLRRLDPARSARMSRRSPATRCPRSRRSTVCA